MDRITEIKKRLQSLNPSHIEVIDESHLHAGHEGAKSGGGHFSLTIVSNTFKDQSLVERHRLVYDTLGDLMQKEIHALSINASTEAER